jgi:NitT/TauT family transport system ATP-binding protein
MTPVSTGYDDRVSEQTGGAARGRTKVKIDAVSKRFPIRGQARREKVVLRNVDLEIGDGEFLTLIGPSGCGKTTLMEIVAGLQTASSGRVLIEGEEIRGPGPDRAVVFQHYALFPWRTVVDNVALPLEVARVGKSARREVARQRLNDVGLADFAEYYPAQLSGGMRQRVALARAFVRDPAVLLMDEPFGALDAITRDLLQEQLAGLHQAQRKTVIFVTHSVSEAIRLSNRIIVLGLAPADIVGEFDLGPHTGASASELTQRELRHANVRDEVWALLRAHGARLETAGSQRGVE